MKKLIFSFLFLVLILTSLPSFANDQTSSNGWPRHRVIVVHRGGARHRVIIVHRPYHRYYRYRRLPPVWYPRDPWW